jgi:lactam utilization protein B
MGLIAALPDYCYNTTATVLTVLPHSVIWQDMSSCIHMAHSVHKASDEFRPQLHIYAPSEYQPKMKLTIGTLYRQCMHAQ